MEEKIKEYLLNLAGEKGVTLENDTDLFKEGVLDSLGFIMFLVFIQEELGLEFSEEDMKAENFTTINDVVAFVKAK